MAEQLDEVKDDGDWLQIFDSLPRHLTQSEQLLLERDRVTLSDYKLKKLEDEAQKNWDIFYKRNTTAFYKDRHWTTREFPELKQVSKELLVRVKPHIY